MAEPERIDPNPQSWADKRVRGAVGRHIFEAEGTWFLDFKTDDDDQAFLTRRFREAFGRYATREPASGERRSLADEGGDRRWGEGVGPATASVSRGKVALAGSGTLGFGQLPGGSRDDLRKLWECGRTTPSEL